MEAHSRRYLVNYWRHNSEIFIEKMMNLEQTRKEIASYMSNVGAENDRSAENFRGRILRRETQKTKK